MWGILILSIMTALIGFYTVPVETNAAVVVAGVQVQKLAEDMALYRQAVITYFTANDLKNTSVSIAILKSTNALPSWSGLYIQPSTSIWANYRDSSGAIYIYPLTRPSMDITSEIVRISQNSVMAGVYRASDSSLYSPADGVRVSVPSLASVSVPDGAPVWMAMRN